MKANELMLNNWVYYEKTPHIITAIDSGNYGRSRWKGQAKDEPDYEHPFSQLEPIPLTTEILEKCGFVKDNGNFKGEIIFVRGKFFITESMNFCLAVGWEDIDELQFVGYELNDGDNPVKYLHQLQNLIHALTGKELEIEL